MSSLLVQSVELPDEFSTKNLYGDVESPSTFRKRQVAVSVRAVLSVYDFFEKSIRYVPPCNFQQAPNDFERMDFTFSWAWRTFVVLSRRKKDRMYLEVRFTFNLFLLFTVVCFPAFRLQRDFFFHFLHEREKGRGHFQDGVVKM